MEPQDTARRTGPVRVKVFVDGANLYRSILPLGPPRINYAKLRDWLMRQVSACMDDVSVTCVGVDYYTAVPGERLLTPQGADYKRTLEPFLEMLRVRYGYTVHRFKTFEEIIVCRKCKETIVCPKCGAKGSRFEEGEVDTALTADMIECAADRLADAIVLVSGDSDFLPGVQKAQERYGIPVFVSGWSDLTDPRPWPTVAERLKEGARAYFNLADGGDEFVEPRRLTGQDADSTNGDT